MRSNAGAAARRLQPREELIGIGRHRRPRRPACSSTNLTQPRSCFWDEKGSKERDDPQRVALLARDRGRFREKYPGVPGDIPPPECGW